MRRRLNTRTLVAIAVTLLLWASAFAGIRIALRAYGPGHLALFRFLIASGALLAYALVSRMKLPRKADVPQIVLTGFLGITVYHVTLNWGEVSVSASSASFLVNAAPVITAILATLLLGERITAWGWGGIGTSFAGVALIALGEGARLTLEPGVLLILTSALATSLYFILQKKLLQRYSVIEITTYAIWAGTAFMLVFLPGLPRTIASAPLPATLAVIYLGIFPAAIAYVTWSYVLSRAPASRAATFLFLSPLLATLIAWIWLSEAPGAIAFFGGLLTLSGVVLVNWKGR